MSKAILVMDMPDKCGECEYFGFKCKLTNEKCNWYHEDGRPGHCLLSPLPKKDNGNYFPDEWQDGYAAGWNACLNKILDKGNRG